MSKTTSKQNYREQYLAELESIAGTLKEFRELDEGDLFDIGLAYLQWNSANFIEWLSEYDEFISDIVPLLVNVYASGENDYFLVRQEFIEYVVDYVAQNEHIEFDYDERLTQAKQYMSMHRNDEYDPEES